MLKLVIIVAAVGLLLWLLFGRASRLPPGGAKPGARGSAEGMVACAQCGVHLPRSEALAARGLHYCSAAHRDLPPPSS
jgi:uncharacterized protein